MAEALMAALPLAIGNRTQGNSMNDSMICLVMAFLIALALVAFWRLIVVLVVVSFVAMIIYGAIMIGETMANIT